MYLGHDKNSKFMSATMKQNPCILSCEYIVWSIQRSFESDLSGHIASQFKSWSDTNQLPWSLNMTSLWWRINIDQQRPPRKTNAWCASNSLGCHTHTLQQPLIHPTKQDMMPACRQLTPLESVQQDDDCPTVSGVKHLNACKLDTD